MATLTVDKVRKFKDPGRYGDGGGLYLNVAPGGSKSWVLRIQQGGKRTDKGLGGFPAVSLSAARRLAEESRVAVKRGEAPPKAVKPAAPKLAPTFEEATLRFYEGKQLGWKNAKHSRTWLQSFKLHVFPKFGSVTVDEVTRADVLDALAPLWPTTPETARRIRSRIRGVFQWAIAYGHIESNPAGEAIEGALPKVPPSGAHHKALHYAKVPAAYQHLTRIRYILDPQPHKVTLLALEFLIFTAARSAEVRGMTWNEVSADGSLWTIPAHRMKAGKEHRVPLSGSATFVLGQARDLGRGDGLVFPGAAGHPIAESVLLDRCKADKLGCTPHGFRSSFRDWAAERTSYSREAIEFSLAHAPGGRVEMAYFRSDLLEQRRALLEEWGQFVTGIKPPF